jgi:tetratricopeptide (TPR) repeat protein
MQPMAVDPYSPCPCGSGQKFKWCCHKVESYADRAQKLYEGGQIEQALQALDEGLKKEPGNAWLLTRKALIQTRMNRPDDAQATLRLVLGKQPKHLGALVLMTRLMLETKGPSAGVVQLQQALGAFPASDRKGLAGLVKVVGAFLAEAGDFPAARKHLIFSLLLAQGEPDPAVVSTLQVIGGNPSISPWLKNADELSDAPDETVPTTKVRFLEALVWAEEGLWSSAAAAFETLASDPVAGAVAERNAGFCRLWLADDAAAVASLRRYAARIGATPEAVDIEALCQQVAPDAPDDLVEHVQLIWPLRDRSALLEALNADPTVHSEGTGPIDPDQENAPDVDQFALLDRPDPRHGRDDNPADDGSTLTQDQIPRVIGRAFVGQEIAALETYDDGRLDRLSERFSARAGAALAPAHPRTKVLGSFPRLQLALTWEWLLPDGIDPEEAHRLNREQGAALIRDVWPNIPLGFLRGRTPLQAATDGDAEVPLRAALFLLELSREPWRQGFDFGALRSRLNIPPEPVIDPETVDVTKLHLARLTLVPADRLSDETLVDLYDRSRAAALTDALEAAALALVARPEAIERLEIDSMALFRDLATIAAGRGDRAAAADWVRLGRQADPAAVRARNAPLWDMLDLRIRAQAEGPRLWVPELAVILERYRENVDATQLIMMGLIDMGLIEMVSSPDRPGEVSLDTRVLQTLLSEYGPRVTTASGRLGVSATRPEIWTPGSSTGSSGGLWTPGSTTKPAGPAGEKKIIITG